MNTTATVSIAYELKCASPSSYGEKPPVDTVENACESASNMSIPARA